VGARTQNWADETDMAHLPRLNVPVWRRLHERVHMMEHMYLDRDGYEDQHPQRRGMYEEAEHPAYGRAPIPYVTQQPVVGDIPPRVFAYASTLRPHPLASMVPVRAAVWEHANTKSSGLAGFCAKSGDFRVTLVSSMDSVKYRRLRTCRICFFSPLLLDLPEFLVSGLFEVLLFPDLPLPDSTPKS
jgi:hypothetical protein